MSNPGRRQNRAARSAGQEFGEENHLYQELRKGLEEQQRECSKSNDLERKITAYQQQMKAKGGTKNMTVDETKTLEDMFREAVRLSDIIKGIIDRNHERTVLLKALTEASEKKVSDAPRRSAASRETPTFKSELDSTLNSPALSPMPEKKGKERGSGLIPPKDSVLKKEDVETASVGSSAAIEPSKKKITFKEKDNVAFRPKGGSGSDEQPDWIQGVVIKVIGDGKSRRYDVQDPEPDDAGAKTVYRTSASSMVPIPDAGSMDDYPEGKTVLARYPDTTTFYSAVVVRMNGVNVVLRFDGEDETEKTTEVDRRFVLDHKG